MGFVKKQYETLKYQKIAVMFSPLTQVQSRAREFPRAFLLPKGAPPDATQTKAIRSVNSMKCETLLEMRYITFLAWDQIASHLNYSQDYIYHLHRKALGLVKAPRV